MAENRPAPRKLIETLALTLEAQNTHQSAQGHDEVGASGGEGGSLIRAANGNNPSEPDHPCDWDHCVIALAMAIIIIIE